MNGQSRGPFFAGVGGGAVPVPNTLFDEVMPQLKDSELRVLLVVVRQTLGFREADDSASGASWRYKRRDWISHSQLVKKTGRGSEAVSAAVDSLVRQGLIVVEDTAGRPLDTAASRRRHLGRLYFRLPSNPGGVDMWKKRDGFLPAKAKTTTNNRNNKKKGSAAATPVAGARSRSRSPLAEMCHPGVETQQPGGAWSRAVQGIERS